MEEDLIALLGTITFILVIIGLLCLIFIPYKNNNAKASEDALKECVLRGFDSYTSYKRMAFSGDALGVKCNHIDNKREYVGLENGGAVIIAK